MQAKIATYMYVVTPMSTYPGHCGINNYNLYNMD